MSKKKEKKKKPDSGNLVKGVLDITRSGAGYLIVPGIEKDIFIRPNDFGTAFNGDTVRVKVSDNHGKRAEGKVVEVVQRKQTEFIGNIEVSANFSFFRPDSQKPIPDFYVSTNHLNGAKNNDRVVVKLLNWDKGEKKPEGEVVSVMQGSDISDMAMKEILIENGFPLKFPDEVLAEAATLKEEINQEEIKKRRDCRNILTFTIDPFDAKDFDDAISFQSLPNDEFEIGVHIADVSHFVKPAGILNEAAYARATSVYLPDRVNPMLPEKISNELCSLRPNEDKYTFSIIFLINRSGQIKNYWLGKTLIHSDRRFTYEEVQEIIESGNGDHKDEILLLNKLAQQFRTERFRNGAINFSSTEVKFKLDETGKPVGIVVKESKEAHQLIEEFMLLANKTVAQHISKIKVKGKPVPFPYRVHDTPSEEKLKPFVAFAKKFGYHFDLKDETAVAASFNKMLLDVKGKPEQHVLEQLGIRTMAKAIYTAENVGHYGLGFENYCHFTSPIRRYPDIMVHRILEEVINNTIIPDKKMDEECKHCSTMERSAMDAERAGNKYKQVEFMSDFIGDDFDGVVNGVSSFGFWVETVMHKCEGLVSARDLSDYDDFRLDETDYALVGLRTGKRFRMGDVVRVKLVAANLTKRQLDFELMMPGVTPKEQAGNRPVLKANSEKNQTQPSSDNFDKYHKKKKKKK